MLKIPVVSDPIWLNHKRKTLHTPIFPDYHDLYIKKIRGDPSPSDELNAFLKAYGWDIATIVRKFVLDGSKTAIVLSEETILPLRAHTCNINIKGIGHLFMEHYAFGFQKDSEIAPLFNYWILKAQQSGDLSFWKAKVRKHIISIASLILDIQSFFLALSNRA